MTAFGPSGRGKLDLDLGALVGLAADMQKSAVALDDLGDDRQTKASSAAIPAPRGVGTVEAFGKPREMAGLHSLAPIANEDYHPSTAARQSDQDSPTFASA